MRGFQLRYLMPVALISACLVALSVVTAVSLFGQQESVTRVLRENVQSHRAAVELEECLHDLALIEDDHVTRVRVLHDRVRTLLARLLPLADQPEEKVLLAQMIQAFDAYLSRWGAATDDTARRLTFNGFLTVDGRNIYQMTNFTLE